MCLPFTYHCKEKADEGLSRGGLIQALHFLLSSLKNAVIVAMLLSFTGKCSQNNKYPLEFFGARLQIIITTRVIPCLLCSNVDCCFIL